MEGTEAAAVQRRARTGVWVLGVLSACLLVLAAAVVFAAVRERGQSVTEREPGCTSLTFHNTVPAPVVELVEAQYRAGFDLPVWEITGTETPVDDDGRQGAPRRWVTERFVLVP